jgi:hypothetical protein
MKPEKEFDDRSRIVSLDKEPRVVGRVPVRELFERLRRVRERSSRSEEGRVPVISREGRASDVIVVRSAVHEMPDQSQTSPMGEEVEILHLQPVTVRVPRLVELRRSQQAV